MSEQNPVILDVSKVNILEKDIEEWLFLNPSFLDYGWGTIDRWFGRQYQLPSGIADLIGVTERGALVVVEVKNVAIGKAAVLQVCRYASDLQEIASYRMSYPREYPGKEWSSPVVRKVLIGPSVDSQTYTEAVACGVFVMTFVPRLTLTVSRLGWSMDYREEREKQFETISWGKEWEGYGLHIQEHSQQQEALVSVVNELDTELGMILDSADQHDLPND